MSIETGNTTIRRFKIKGDVPSSSNESWMKSINENKFRHKELGQGEKNCGWVDYDSPLNTYFQMESFTIGKFIVLGLRIDSMTIDAKLLKATVQARIKTRLIGSDTKCLSAKQKAEIREEVVEELAANTKPKMNSVEVFIDTVGKYVYLCSVSNSISDLFCDLFIQTFDCELSTVDFLSRAMIQNVSDIDKQEVILDDPSGGFMPVEAPVNPEFEDSQEGKIGSGFLTWILAHRKHSDDLEDDQYMVSDNIVFEGEREGSKTMVVKGGTAAKSEELFSALSVGKLVSKFNFDYCESTDVDGNESIVSLTIDKFFDLRSIKLPKKEEPDFHSRMLGRLVDYASVFEYVDGLFKDYLELRYSRMWADECRAMCNWVNDNS